MPQKKTPGKRTTESVKLEASKTKSPKAPAKASAKIPARTRAPKPTPMPPNGRHELTHDEIAAKAYSIWESRGKPHGSPQEDWFRAQQELSG